ncbi:hypothetical protein ACE10Z_41335 [Bradyrhizobium sp. Pha-3]|uniref:hypothetical protein n=1 Tax=Bradyrhizobium sp. Pha-3 TaxID=208375 RepID=UPI0035D44AED
MAGRTHIERQVVPTLAGAESSDDVALYLELFETATRDVVPVHFLAAYGHSFRQHIENPVWVVQSLISNAVKEGEGARDLSETANECERKDIQADLAVHVEDEARHCRMYVQMIDTVFPGALPTKIRDEIERQFPPARFARAPKSPTSDYKILDHLIQINLGEVRTRIHQKLLEPVLYAYAPTEKRPLLCRTLCAIADDECCHIKYTASRIGALAREVGKQRCQELFSRRVKDFEAYTQTELGRQKEGLFGTKLVRDR